MPEADLSEATNNPYHWEQTSWTGTKTYTKLSIDERNANVRVEKFTEDIWQRISNSCIHWCHEHNWRRNSHEKVEKSSDTYTISDTSIINELSKNNLKPEQKRVFDAEFIRIQGIARKIFPPVAMPAKPTNTSQMQSRAPLTERVTQAQQPTTAIPSPIPQPGTPAASPPRQQQRSPVQVSTAPPQPRTAQSQPPVPTSTISPHRSPGLMPIAAPPVQHPSSPSRPFPHPAQVVSPTIPQSASRAGPASGPDTVIGIGRDASTRASRVVAAAEEERRKYVQDRREDGRTDIIRRLPALHTETELQKAQELMAIEPLEPPPPKREPGDKPKMLEQAHLNRFIMALKTGHKNGSQMSHSYSPCTLAKGTRVNPSLISLITAKDFGPKAPEDKNLFVYPIFIPREGTPIGHWCLVMIDRTKKTVEFYDSYAVYGDKDRDKENVHYLNQVKERLEEISGEPYEVQNKIKTRIQSGVDGSRCGMWLLYFIQKRLENPDFDFDLITNHFKQMDTQGLKTEDAASAKAHQENIDSMLEAEFIDSFVEKILPIINPVVGRQ